MLLRLALLLVRSRRGKVSLQVVSCFFRLTKSQKVYRYVSEGNVDGSLKQRMPLKKATEVTFQITELYSYNYLLVNSGYASIPHSPISTPSYSSSCDTRIPIIILITNQTINEAKNTQIKMVAAPTS